MTMAPIVAKGVVIVGNSGGEFGVRGWLAGLDAKDGKILWRAYAMGPDKDVLIGPNFHPFYAADRGAGSRSEDLARRGMEDRRRFGLELDLLRSRT